MEALAGFGFFVGLLFFLLWLFIIIEFFYIGSRVGKIARNSDQILALLERGGSTLK
jgi:uncharacterized BrkB/YihY/UPF0761 family membrane protein